MINAISIDLSKKIDIMNIDELNNNGLPQRRSIRLKGYDYSQACLYFITIVTQKRKNLFGEIQNGKMILNNAGYMVEKLWHETTNRFVNIKLHEQITMPNHFHGIIEIIPMTTTVGADSISARNITDSVLKRANNSDSISARDMGKTGNIPHIVQSFKRHTTIEYIKMVKQKKLPPFDKRIWQRNYWEHIIRNGDEYQRISQYIIDNPVKWEMDKLNHPPAGAVRESSANYSPTLMGSQSIYNEEIWMI